MLKVIALQLLAIILIVGADYVGRHGNSYWLALPLALLYAGTVIAAIRFYVKNYR